jgi:hypothetical protein
MHLRLAHINITPCMNAQYLPEVMYHRKVEI